MFIKKILLVIVVIFTFSLLTAVNAQSKEENKNAENKQNQNELSEEKAAAKPWNEVCPVRGGKVQKETALVEYEDKQYGFCCPGCDSKFEKEPEKYSQNLSEDGKKFIGKK